MTADRFGEPVSHSYFDGLFTGYRCEECGWIGGNDEVYAIAPDDEPLCPLARCRSPELTPIRLCAQCGDREQFYARLCSECHVHVFEDGACECGAQEITRRDQVEPVQPLVRP